MSAVVKNIYSGYSPYVLSFVGQVHPHGGEKFDGINVTMNEPNASRRWREQNFSFLPSKCSVLRMRNIVSFDLICQVCCILYYDLEIFYIVEQAATNFLQL